MLAGLRLGRYELLARIATGGMGEIFLARLEGAAGFEKLYVIKRILPHLAGDNRFRAMLIGEAQIASNMSHANICHVYELDETNDQLYMVMEYLEGATLLQLLRLISQTSGELACGFVAGVIQQACEGLHYAHELRDRSGSSLGVIHRDVTPSNLFLTESGVVKIVDFGIAKVKNTAGTGTDSGVVKGKYAYMAPEQLRGQVVDRRADVFSIGVVSYEMLTCRRLFQRKTDYLTFRAVMEQAPIDLRRHRPDAPEAVAHVLDRALARDRERRYATVRQFAAALLEAFDTIRPWGQADISELVRTTFAEEISLNSAEISRVVRRSGGPPPQTIPVIMRVSPVSDQTDYFSIETDFAEGPTPGFNASSFSPPSDLRAGHAHSVRQSGQRRRTLPLTRGRRTLLPVVAVLGIAAVALIVGLVLIGDRAPRLVAAEKPAPTGPALAAGAAPAAPVDAYAPRRARSPSGPYGAALRSYERELDRCARDSGEVLSADAKVVIVVGVDGHVKRATMQPQDTERGKLGGCIRHVLQIVKFPTVAIETEVTLGLAIDR